jgi:maltose/moltooligosaccharide transporter
MENNKEGKPISSFILSQVILIGIIYAAAQIFGYLEANIFNTYLVHVLNSPLIAITIMVNLSATVGLISNFLFGILSDNTRTKFGRRKPYILFGGLLAGIMMILYAFSTDYLTAVFIDVVAIGIASNAYYVAQRVIIPDTIDIEYRGRANGIANVLGNVGLIISIAIFLIINEFFGEITPEGTIISRDGYIFSLSIGGFGIIIIGILSFLFLREKPVSEMPPKKSFSIELKEIFQFQELKKYKEFFKLILAYTIFQSGTGVIMPFLFVFIFDLGLSTLELIMIIGIAAPILFIIILILGKISDKYGRKKSLAPTILISCVGFFMMTWLGLISETLIFLFVIAFSLVLITILGVIAPLDTLSQDLLPEDKRGKFFGILNIIFTVSQIIGATVGGIVAEIFGVAWIFTFAPIFFIASIPLFWRVKETLPEEFR